MQESTEEMRTNMEQPIQRQNPYKIGDRVEWTRKDTTLGSGSIRSMRKERITVVVDNKPGYTCSGHFEAFRPTTIPAPKETPAPELTPGKLTRHDPPMLLDDFTVTGYKFSGGHEGNGYNATLRYKGKIVGKMYNDGVGGCGELTCTSEVEKLLEFALTAAWTINGGKSEDNPGFYDLMDIWAYWAGKLKAKGRCFYEEIEEMQAMFNK